MLKILINAYACCPDMGSEPGMAWNWCVNLARYCELYIITEGEFKDKIEEKLKVLPQAKNMHFYYNPVSEKVRRMCWNQGDWRFYRYYRQWQWKTYEMAKGIIAKVPIDIVHQLNMIGFREPGYLWKIEEIPFVWGPVDAKERFPVAYLCGAGMWVKLKIRLKNFLTIYQLKYSMRVRAAVKSASCVLSASSNSQQTFKKYFGLDSPLLNETGCNVQTHCNLNSSDKNVLNILWVGKMDFRKQLGLALGSLAYTKNTNMQLHIVGGGDTTYYRNLAISLGVKERCKWYGAISHEKVQKIMQESDLFFFTSVSEGTPHVVLEAIDNYLPVLCFDTCGQGDVVNEQVGIKIPLSNPKQSVKDFAGKIEYLYAHRELLAQFSQNCRQRQIELSWDIKAKRMITIYQSYLKNKYSS